MLIVERLERFRVPQFSPFNGLGFAEFYALFISWLGQAAFSGRTLWDAA
jgi:hypothetical protein